MNIPSAIIFINSDIDAIAQNKLITQLKVNEFITKQEFDLRILADPNYPIILHLQNIILLVSLSSFTDLSNRQYADVVLFVKQGMVTVLQNNYGPPTLSLPVERLNIFNLLAGIKNISQTFSCHKCNCGCKCNCFKHLPIPLQQMLINPFDISGVHNANCDNEYNNENWINRG